MGGFRVNRSRCSARSGPRYNAGVISASCEFCGHDVPSERNNCPHCGRQCPFPPNVRAAQAEPERRALNRRYRSALVEAGDHGAEEVVRRFGAAVRTSRAVIARPLRDVERLASSDRELYPTFYGLTEGEVRVSFGDKWDILRRVADAALFPGYEKHIRFAALSLDGVGLDEFGECSLVLREDMIAHRASAFEANSASFVERHHHPVQPGFRSTWEERSKLCTAKHAKELPPGLPDSELPAKPSSLSCATGWRRRVSAWR